MIAPPLGPSSGKEGAAALSAGENRILTRIESAPCLALPCRVRFVCRETETADEDGRVLSASWDERFSAFR